MVFCNHSADVTLKTYICSRECKNDKGILDILFMLLISYYLEADSFSGCETYNICDSVTVCSHLDSQPSLPGKWLTGSGSVWNKTAIGICICEAPNVACLAYMVISDCWTAHKHLPIWYKFHPFSLNVKHSRDVILRKLNQVNRPLFRRGYLIIDNDRIAPVDLKTLFAK